MTQASVDETKHLKEIEAEECVLGALLLEADPAKISWLEPTDFYRKFHRDVFAAMMKLYQRGEGIDYLTVEGVMKAKGPVEPEEMARISSLTDKVPSTANLVQYAKRVKVAAERRRLIADMGELVDRLREGANPKDILDEASNLRCYDSEQGPDVYSMREALAVAVEEVEKIKSQQKVGTVPFGFKSLEKYEPRPGNVVIIGAHPSVGKSEFALEVGMNLGKQGIPSLFVSSEMTLEDSLWRVLSRESLIPADRFKSTEPFDLTEVANYGAAIQRVSDLPIHWSLLTHAGRICGLMRSMARRGLIKVAFIDYLQLLDLPDGDNRNLEVQAASRMFKRTARDCGIVLYLLSQLNRKTDRSGGMPSMRDLRDSGAIEQDADIVIMLDRAVHGRDLKGEVLKNRNGDTGPFEMSFIRGHIFDDKE